uniref:Uncharacterized protein n=1 Tax=Cucumis sativus TaxID=3659 RepID=A0A0A0K908_CUCSA
MEASNQQPIKLRKRQSNKPPKSHFRRSLSMKKETNAKGSKKRANGTSAMHGQLYFQFYSISSPSLITLNSNLRFPSNFSINQQWNHFFFRAMESKPDLKSNDELQVR